MAGRRPAAVRPSACAISRRQNRAEIHARQSIAIPEPSRECEGYFSLSRSAFRAIDNPQEQRQGVAHIASARPWTVARRALPPGRVKLGNVFGRKPRRFQSPRRPARPSCQRGGSGFGRPCRFTQASAPAANSSGFGGLALRVDSALPRSPASDGEAGDMGEPCSRKFRRVSPELDSAIRQIAGITNAGRDGSPSAG